MEIPEGPFSLASKDINWEYEEIDRLGVCLTGWIPEGRLDDFREGEDARGSTHFVCQHHYVNKEVPSTLTKQRNAPFLITIRRNSQVLDLTGSYTNKCGSACLA